MEVPATPEFEDEDVIGSEYEDLTGSEFEDDDSTDSEFDLDYIVVSDFMVEGRLKILQSARRIFRVYYELGMEETTLGADIIAECFSDSQSLSSSELFSKIKLDAETLKSHLSLEMHPRDGIESEELGRQLGYYPDWEELAQYIKQLKESEGFDLDEYKNLGKYTNGSPIKLSNKRLLYHAKELGESMEAAMKFYGEAGGGELKEGKLVKANVFGEFTRDTFYITFTAKSCLDGKKRHYQAKVMYNVDLQVAVTEKNIMVRLKKEPSTN